MVRRARNSWESMRKKKKGTSCEGVVLRLEEEWCGWCAGRLADAGQICSEEFRTFPRFVDKAVRMIDQLDLAVRLDEKEDVVAQALDPLQ